MQYLALWEFHSDYLNLQCVGKNLTKNSGNIFKQEFLNKILHAYIVFIFVQNYKILFNYLLLWQNFATLSMIV